MGEVSNAVFWGDGLNAWANPALLGYHKGIRYEWGKTQLVPGLATDVFFKTNVIKLGGGGLGVSLSGKPIEGLGSLKLDYGLSEGADENGNPTGTFGSHEDIASWGFGISVARAFESVARLAGHEPPAWSRMADVSVGMNSKKVDIVLGPGGEGSTSALDRGLLVRLSPLEWILASRDLPLGFDYAYGWSELSYDGAVVNFPSEDAPAPLSYHHRRGYAARLALEIPARLLNEWEHRSGGWLVAGFDPLVSYGFASDRATIEPSGGQFKTEGSGYEISVANVFAYRSGEFKDPLGGIDGSTRGWSIGLPLGRVGGLRYERATIPQAANSGLGDVERKAISGWIDPLELWVMWHGGRPAR